MATIKSFTSLEQSKKLAEILPLESADGFWEYHDKWFSEGDEWEGYEDYPRTEPYLEYTRKENEWKEDKSDVPCWSLAALLNALPNGIVMNKDSQNGRYHFSSKYVGTYVTADNPIDACVELILKLCELKML